MLGLPSCVVYKFVLLKIKETNNLGMYETEEKLFESKQTRRFFKDVKKLT